MKTLTVNKKEYKVEYFVEASLNVECLKNILSMLYYVSLAETTQEKRQVISKMVSDIPQTTINVLYAGLLENNEGITAEDAKQVTKEYLIENKGTDKGSYYALLTELIEIMSDDGFFELVGVKKMISKK